MANGKFELMALPYEADALEPVVSKDYNKKYRYA